MGDSKATSKQSSNGSCIPTGVPESDTGDSGEESEPTYRHYDHFETDVCLTQDEDEPLPSNVPLIQTPTPRRIASQDFVARDAYPGGNPSRGVSSDSDSCTESEMFPDRGGRNTDGTTTSTSESEETQIWVPVSKRPSTKQETSPPPQSASSSNGSDGQSRPSSMLPASIGMTTGSLSIITSPGTEIKLKEDGRRSSAQNTMSSVISKRAPANKQLSLGLLRHDETTGTITLDIHNVQNGDLDTDHSIDRDFPSEEKNMRFQPAEKLSFHTLNNDMCGLLSVLYAVIIMVVGLVVAVAEIYVVTPIPSLFEGYFIFLLIVSIAFLVFAFSYTVRLKALTPGRVVVTRLPAQQKTRNPTNSQTGGFYFRLGAVFFGIGSMIKSGLHFGESFEMISVPECNNVLHAVRPMVQILFTFTQLYFVFFNAKMCLHHYHHLARFGLMHMIATNVCIWFDNVVKETLRNLNSKPDIYNETSTEFAAQSVGSDCYGESLMGEVVKTSGPYLYPCTIQYSWIAASLLFLMWCKVHKKKVQKLPFDDQETKTENKTDVDCSSSSRGLFLGIIVLVAIVITTITFFVLVQTTTYTTHALQLEHISDLTIYVVMTASALLAYYRMLTLQYHYSGKRFEHCLLFLSLIAVFILCVCNIIAGGFYRHNQHGILLGFASLFHLIQAAVQFILLISAAKRYAKTREQETDKPGREFITFLLICNVAVLGLKIFMFERWTEHGIQRLFYGDIGWEIIEHVTEPFLLFFRFISTVLLVSIWMHSWKIN